MFSTFCLETSLAPPKMQGYGVLGPLAITLEGWESGAVASPKLMFDIFRFGDTFRFGDNSDLATIQIWRHFSDLATLFQIWRHFSDLATLCHLATLKRPTFKVPQLAQSRHVSDSGDPLIDESGVLAQVGITGKSD